MKSSTLVRLALAGTAATLVACGGGSSTPATAESLSGTVRGSDGTGLPDVIVLVEDDAATRSASARTDAMGHFVVLEPPAGSIHVEIDPSAVTSGNFPPLELVDTIGNGAAVLSQPIVLPDLDDGGTMSVSTDMSGVTSGANTVVSPDGSTLEIPDMTTILVDGAPPTGPVDVNVTPVPAQNVPMPLPDSLDASSFVTIQPGNARFSPGLDIIIPNTRGFADGAMVDIWSFDHDVGDWVNRSEETGNQGVVMDVMGNSMIVASAVITEGGWHAGALPVDPDCATTMTGRVVASGTTTPVDDALVSLGTGQFARTGADGTFSIPLVPAYDAEDLPSCTAVDVYVGVIGSVGDGGNTTETIVPAGMVTPGGTTDAGDIPLVVAMVGSVAGSVLEDGQPVDGTVTIAGPTNTTAESVGGAFFATNLAPGAYTASFDFTNGTDVEPFTIVAGETTVVALASNTTTGGGEVNVQVLSYDSDISLSTGVPVEGACVTLQAASGGALFGTTDASGIAAFDNVPAGPYTATAQLEIADVFGSTRVGVSVVGVNPTGSPKTITLPSFFDGAFSPPVGDATFEGAVINAPGATTLSYQLSSIEAQGFGAQMPLAGASFSAAVPSGVMFDAAVTAVSNTTGETVAAVILKDLTVASGQTLMEDFDFAGANAHAFDQAAGLTISNEPGTGDAFSYLFMVGSGDLEFPLFEGSDLPASILLPNLASSRFTGSELFLEFDKSQFQKNSITGAFCTIPVGPSTPANVAVDFLGLPTISAPANGAEFESFGAGDTVSFSLGAGNGEMDGFNNVLFLSTFQEDSELKVAFWDLFLAPTATSLTVPQVFPTKPMFGDGFAVVSVIPLRLDLQGFDFLSFFDGNLATNISMIEASVTCQATAANLFTVGEPLFLPKDPRTHRTIRRLQRIATQRMEH